MKRIFSGMTAQQAPTPRSARHALVLLPGTLQIASQIPHCARLNSAFASRKTKTRVMIDEKIEENRLARSQRSARAKTPRPECERSAREPCMSAADVMSSALHQRDVCVVPVHEQADAQADGQEHQHDQRNGIDGLAGLVQSRVGDRDDIL